LCSLHQDIKQFFVQKCLKCCDVQELFLGIKQKSAEAKYLAIKVAILDKIVLTKLLFYWLLIFFYVKIVEARRLKKYMDR